MHVRFVLVRVVFGRLLLAFVSKTFAGEIFSGGGGVFFLGWTFCFFISIFLIALVKRLSLRGTHKRDSVGKQV
jgi:hypothetical protein